MNIEAAIVTRLLTKSAVTALVGEGAAARIRPYKLWQKDNLAVGPALVVSIPKAEHLNDLGTHEGGLIRAESMLACFAETLDGARDLAEAVRVNGTDPGTGLAGDEWTAAGVEVQSCCLEWTETAFVFYQDESDEGCYVVTGHYVLMCTEST